MNETREVIKHSAAIQIENKINLLQRRVWNVLLANAYDKLTMEDSYSIKVSELMDTLEYQSKNERHLKESLKALVKCDLEWNILDKDKTISWGVTTLIPEARIENGVCSTRIVHS